VFDHLPVFQVLQVVVLIIVEHSKLKAIVKLKLQKQILEINSVVAAIESQSHEWYRGPNEFVHHFAYRGSSHRRKGAARHDIIDMVWLYRSPITEGGGSIILVQMISNSLRGA
jgi:hypothetical protein